MSQNQKNGDNKNIDVNMVRQWMENQKKELDVRTQELKLRETDLQNQSKIAEQSISFQYQLLKDRPSEHRKTLKTIIMGIGLVSTLFLLFVVMCLYLDKEQFAFRFLEISGYVVTTCIGYYFGKRSASNKQQQTIQDAEVIDK